MFLDMTNLPESLVTFLDGLKHHLNRLGRDKLGEHFGGEWVFTGCGIRPQLELSAAALFRGKGIYAYGLSLLKFTFISPVFHQIRKPVDERKLCRMGRSLPKL